ncbi:chromosome partitioning protein ParB [Sphingobium sp. TA15]|uniref:ParB-like protein n=1 Tax=Sphingobium indicum (strain DSM 16413 / CCM 7287 / MTCC 6362 / UT26 / NBRC 101211 / UT26S) TaxID=452662 RepID=D4YXV6_SPHIU|nr:ParB N-terminal domain-containing protein [Sphingobium indicum]BAI95188.1 ParB-like protein [Sphingobium indicum UT26S]BDD68060.1 chromosome partitioning protein ParB [Sphingobium sp. TA15]
MELKHIDIAKLSVAAVNMRGKGKADLSNILPSVRARGVLVPLIVRANGSPDSYEIVAGKRRYQAALAVMQESGEAEALPCAVIEAGDDAAALEASLIENIARLDPDEMTQCETFTRLMREGRTMEELSLTFGLTALQVKRTLALGNLLPRIRNLYRAAKIDVVTVRHLTLASKSQQRDWLALLDDESAYVPTGSALKAWLFGGVSIPVKAALFDVDSYEGGIVADLFGEDRYFADVSAFWTAQQAAIEERVEQYRNAGWRDVVLLSQGEPFHGWEYERCPKRKGGKVYVVTSHRGDVAFHEGYLTSKEARKLERQGESGEASDKPSRPEVTSSQQDYIDLHRHAAVRAAMIGHPGLCLRVAVAHMIAGSPLWTIRAEPQRAADAIAESVENSASEARFDAERRRLLALLDFDADTPTITGGSDGLTSLYARLCTLDDATVMSILSVVMGETLDARCDLVDALGMQLGIDMAQVWQADDTLFDGLRDREVIDAMLAEVAGKDIAEANAKETGKTKKQIIRDCLKGSNGRAKVEGWVPRWLRFPASGYTNRGGVASVSRTASAMEAMALSSDTTDEPQVDPAPMSQAA